MPPEDEPPLSDSERGKLLEWLEIKLSEILLKINRFFLPNSEDEPFSV